MEVVDCSLLMNERDSHPANTPSPRVVTEEGISMDCSDLHPQNAKSPIVVRLGGSVMDSRDSLWKKV